MKGPAIFTEILKDIACRQAPLNEKDAVDQDELAVMLIKSGQIGHDIGQMAEIDLNPVIISGKIPVIVDALMILA